MKSNFGNTKKQNLRSEFLPFSLPDIGDEEINEVVNTLKSGWITTGIKTKNLRIILKHI